MSSCGCEKNDDDWTFDQKYKALLIPTKGNIQEITVTHDQIPNLLEASSLDTLTKKVGDYDLILFADGFGHDNGKEHNDIASQFAQEEILGPVLLVDDNGKELKAKDIDTYLE